MVNNSPCGFYSEPENTVDITKSIMAARESNRGEVTKIIYLRDHLAKYTFYRRNYGFIRVEFEYRAYSYSFMPGNSS